ncbi:MAG: MmgE/PrpD family protein [Dehalococcoidia bacterium]|nr:MmgE/PrpD family protein [Dehalococcoidia bacterium]
MTISAPGTSGRKDAIHALVGNVVNTVYEDLSQGAVDATKTFILDEFGVAIAGTLAPGVAETLGLLRDWGGKAESTVLVSGERLPAPSSAMMNSFLMHNQEFDPVHDLAVVHAFTTVLPVALAVAEARGGVSGRELLTAVALGVDMACAIGLSSKSPIAHFRPGTLGAFGAVAAAGKISGFDEVTLSHAMGIVYSQICGTLQPHTEGVQVNSMQTAFNARAAVTAISLADRGIHGPSEVLEGRYGYFRLFEGEYDVADVLANLGSVWRVEQIAHKPFPCGRLTHGAAEAVLILKECHGFRAGDVDDIEVLVPPLPYRLVGRPLEEGVPSPQYAKLSIPYVAAVALIRGTVFINDFWEDRLGDLAVRELAGRITVVQDLTITDQNVMVPQRMRIRLKNGAEHELILDQVLGHPDKPLSRDQHLEKFHACWAVGASHLPERNRDRLADLVDGMEDAPSVEEIVRLLVP